MIAEPDLPTLSDEWQAALQANGYRVTRPLRVIVDLLTTSDRALEPIEIYDLVRRVVPRMGLVTVYRALDKLQELELVQRVHQENGCHMYLRAPEGHEHILLCKRCGRVAFFAGDDLDLLMDRTARQSGFEIQEHWLQLYGVCAECQ
jgi:Fe2+ or Zn2+ uptake regulation protein